MSNYTKSTNFATKDNLTPGDPLKVVRGTEIDTEFNNIATAVATKTDNSAAAITGGSITGITDLAIADGGTGASTATAALNNLLPSQTGNATKYLQTDGSNATWDPISLSTSDITGTLPVANGGTGVTSSTGTGSVVLSNSPTLVTPALGTPASGVATNLTGLPISTGVSGLGTGVATFLGTPSSANLASAVSDETGSGALVFANSPTLVTPTLGTPASATLTNATGLPISTGVSGLGTGVATFLATPSSANLRSALTDETGTGSAVFATSPALVTPDLGTPSVATLTNATGLPIATGVSGLGTGVATALAVNVGSSGAPLVNGGVLGTPSSGTATNLTGLPLTTGVTGTLPTANGGTNLTSFTSGGVVYASSSSALATGSVFTFDGTNLGLGGTTNSYGSQTTLTLSGTNVSRIDFRSNSTYTGSILSYQSTGEGLRLQTESSLPIAFSPNGTEGMRLTTTGLGIGTSSPADGLNIGAGKKFRATHSASVYQQIFSTASGNFISAFGDNLQVTADVGAIFLTATAAQPIVFQTTNTDRLTVLGNGTVKTSSTISVGNATPSTSGAGITFPATQSASSDANTLDDYEEGTWTPSLGGTATYDRQDGNYTKVGRLVNIRCNIVVSSIGTGSTFQISGLPFTTATTPIGNPPASGVVGYFASLAVSPVYISTIAASGGTTINVSGLTAAGATASASLGVFGNSARIDFTMTYYVD